MNVFAAPNECRIRIGTVVIVFAISTAAEGLAILIIPQLWLYLDRSSFVRLDKEIGLVVAVGFLKKDGLYTTEKIWIAVRMNRFSLLYACARLCFLVTGHMDIAKCDVNPWANGPTRFRDLLLPLVLRLTIHDKQITVTQQILVVWQITLRLMAK